MAEPIRDLARPRFELARQVVVCAQEGQPALGQPLDEPLKQIAHRADVAKVIWVVELDVGDDRALRMVEGERAVRFVGLGDQPLRPTRPGA